MENKYNLTKDKNIFVARRNIVDYIWKSANLEGIAVTYPQTQALYNGAIVNGLTADEVIVINNLKLAWSFILENEILPSDYLLLCKLHQIIANNIIYNSGAVRSSCVAIGGTSWTPSIPIESKINEEFSEILNSKNKTATELAIEIMLFIMKKQIFNKGNNIVAMLFANKIMIDNGAGIISISKEDQSIFFEKLIKFYETDDNYDLKEWLYNNCIDGLEL